METVSIQPLAADDLIAAATLLTQLNPDTPAGVVRERLHMLLGHISPIGDWKGDESL